MSNVAFLCLGTMGYPMAGHLSAAGHAVTVYNRSSGKAERWVAEHGGQSAATPRAAAAGAELVFVCSGNEGDVRDVVFGDDGALAGMSEGSVLVDHTTVSAELAREIAAAAASRGVGSLDAPVSGGEAGAVTGELTVMVGGEAEAFDRAGEAIAAYGKKIVLMGPAGAGQLTKMVNQICIAGVLQGLSEGLRFAECAGLDVARAVEVISQGAAQSWQMDNRALTMLERKFDFGFAVDWMRKDLAIALEEAARVAAPLPVARLVDGFYEEIQAAGGSRWDTSSLITRLG
jgi:3-hydroxyisobutyrate dehydrogenase